MSGSFVGDLSSVGAEEVAEGVVDVVDVGEVVVWKKEEGNNERSVRV